MFWEMIYRWRVLPPFFCGPDWTTGSAPLVHFGPLKAGGNSGKHLTAYQGFLIDIQKRSRFFAPRRGR